MSLHPGTYKIGGIENKCNSIITFCTCTSFETPNWFSGSLCTATIIIKHLVGVSENLVSIIKIFLLIILDLPFVLIM